MFKTKNTSNVKEIYQSIIDNSRSKIFYMDLDIDDSFESRFDLVILHSFIIFQYFIEIGDKKNKLSQSLFDFMFHDFENNLREMGFGDIAVNKRMKQFIKAFYGRIDNYSKSLLFFNESNNCTMLTETISRNIYKEKTVEAKCIEFWKNYIISNIDYMNSNTLDDNIDSLFSFNELKI